MFFVAVCGCDGDGEESGWMSGWIGEGEVSDVLKTNERTEERWKSTNKRQQCSLEPDVDKVKV